MNADGPPSPPPDGREVRNRIYLRQWAVRAERGKVPRVPRTGEKRKVPQTRRGERLSVSYMSRGFTGIQLRPRQCLSLARLRGEA